MIDLFIYLTAQLLKGYSLSSQVVYGLNEEHKEESVVYSLLR